VNDKEHASADSTWIYSVLPVHARKKPGKQCLQLDDKRRKDPAGNGAGRYELYGHMHRIGYVHFGHCSEGTVDLCFSQASWNESWQRAWNPVSGVLYLGNQCELLALVLKIRNVIALFE
jgi:hypothetical protein